ncbi:PH (Pleckstrin Homology) domain-containing protein [Stackebrandtia albiflava]|uniref:PH (Pleckstrin Homology) domain-containing protein n=1 Tax=Stackebrandtia albiflava TaxID=406432 RepID=A0A562UPJ1_9ACTN|nr:PH domain-containing protein [Stackebrandtia albiflava]TWJ07531.1 PH (Pleckstrin Homology) domain-containing protein [Stackebrandtia albiflava]
MSDADKQIGGDPDFRVTEPVDPPNQRRPTESAAPDIAEDDLTGFRFDASGSPLGPSTLPVPDVPSPLSARYLFPTEKYRGEWRRHWIHLMPVIVIGVLATFIGGYAIGLLGKGGVGAAGPEFAVTAVVVVYLAVLSWVAWKIADWYFDRFILTNKRVMVISGIITRKVAMMPLLRVTDMKYEQSPLGRMMNYGTFVMESAGQDQALREVKHLPDPNELYLQICEEMYEPEAVEARDKVDEEALDAELETDSARGGDA